MSDDPADESRRIGRRAYIATGGAALFGAAGVEYLRGGRDAAAAEALFERPLPPENPTYHHPWKSSELTVGVEFGHDYGGSPAARYFHEENRAAVAFWNDYVAANEDFDLRFRYDPNATDPDVRLLGIIGPKQFSNYDPQYRSPLWRAPHAAAWLCVRTVTERPTGTPPTAAIDVCGGGGNAYRVVAIHALGRLAGYDVGAGPSEYMTLKYLSGPTKTPIQHPDMLGSAYAVERDRRQTYDEVRRVDARMRDTGEYRGRLKDIRQGLTHIESDVHRNLDHVVKNAKESGVPTYVDAVRSIYRGPELAYLDETARLIGRLLDATSTDSEVAHSKAYAEVADRIESITEFGTAYGPLDLRIHRFWCDGMWAKYAD